MAAASSADVGASAARASQAESKSIAPVSPGGATWPIEKVPPRLEKTQPPADARQLPAHLAALVTQLRERGLDLSMCHQHRPSRLTPAECRS